MLIINPLYDQAFKYMMDNEQIAKKILSVILEQEVVSIQSKPQETKVYDKVQNIPLSRFDFKAILRSPENEYRNVLIEIQKSKTPDPINRFRRYLGKNYIKQETYVNHEGREIVGALPIITIYFLGYELKEYKTPVLFVNPQITDVINNVTISEKNDFVKLLTHPSYIIQVGRIKQSRRSRLEKFLSLFDQHCKTDSDYLLDIEPDDNDGFEEIVSHLNKATLDEEMIRSLEYEEDYERGIDELESKLEEERRQKEEERRQKEEAQIREEEERKLKVEAEKKANSAQIKLALKMIEYGETTDAIAAETGLTKQEIDNLRDGK